MDKDVCNRIVAKYEQLERASFSCDLSINVALILGILILFSVFVWALDVPPYIKYIGSLALFILIILLSYSVGRFIFK
jgi:hypothetical protein